MTWLVILAACVAFALGIAFGMSLQWRRNQARPKGTRTRLEDMREDAYDEMKQQEWCCERVKELEARVKELEEDDDDWDDDDDFDAECQAIVDEAISRPIDS